MRDAVRPAVSPGAPGERAGAALPVGTPEHMVVRQRLLDLLDEAVRDSRLTLVCAPAGSGKTALVSVWAALRDVRGPLVWVTTGPREKGRRAFWQRVARAVEDSCQRGAVLRTPVDRSRLAETVRRLAYRAGPVVLVVDEGALPSDPALHRELDQFLQQAGDGIRLVLLARADPVLPLHRYRLARDLAEFRVEDLRFIQPEARDLFAQSGVDLTEEQNATLLQRTGGWPAGLVFAASFLQGWEDVDEALRTFTGSDRAVSDFLVKEFLDGQPANVREVLLRSSVADELPVGLFEALTGAPDGQAVLAFLNRANTFLSPAPGSAYAYQYPPLLREFLRTRLAFEHPELVGELHDVAARWWFRNGSVHEAIRHCIAARHWDEAARYVVEGLVVGEILNDRLDTLAGPFAEMPTTTSTLPAAVIRASLALRHHEPRAARKLLDQVRSSLSEAQAYAGAARAEDPPARRDEALLFSLELLEAGISVLEHDAAGLEAVRRAERHLHALHPSQETLPELWGLLATYRSSLQLWAGDVHQARASLEEVAASARMAQEPAWEVGAHSQAAVLAAVVGDPDTALHLADLADEQMQEQLDPRAGDRARTALARSWVMTDRSLIVPAREELAQAEKSTEASEAVSTGLLTIVRSRLLHAQGYYASSRSALPGAELLRRLPGWLAAWVQTTRRIHEVAEGGQPPREESGSDTLPELDGWQGEPPLELPVTGAVLEADEQLRAGHERAATQPLLRALELAAPQQLRRPFTEAPPAVRQLLRAREDVRATHPWLSTTDSPSRPAEGSALPAVPRQRVDPDSRDRRRGPISTAEDASGATVLVEELTAKELEVLGHLAELHTTDEIASGMFISVNTVRTHVRNVLRKLSVDRRNQAVRRAWELGLLEGPAGGEPPRDHQAQS